MDEAWQPSLMRSLRQHLLRQHLIDSQRREQFPTGGRCHLAIVVEPYLSRLLDGTKTIESRFCRQRKPPFESVDPGDTLILKRSCGPVAGICKVAQAFYFDLRDFPLRAVRDSFGPAIAVTDEAFWKAQEQARFVSLFRVSQMTPLPLIECRKRDRRAWVVMREPLNAELEEASPDRSADVYL